MYSHLTNEELARKLGDYCGSVEAMVPLDLIDELAKRLLAHPDYRPER